MQACGRYKHEIHRILQNAMGVIHEGNGINVRI